METARSKLIVRYLQGAASWTTAAALAAEAGCSPRTVKSDIARINGSHPGLIVAGPKGYRIEDAARAAELLAREGGHVPQSVEERKRHVLFELLMRHRSVSTEELAESLCISLATLDNELVAIKRVLAPYGLVLRSRAGVLFVEGSAAGEKKLVNQLIFDETKDYFSQLDLVNRYFPRLDLKSLRDRIDACLKQHGCFMNGYALTNLILHIAIFSERALNGFGSASEGGVESGPAPLPEGFDGAPVRDDIDELTDDVCSIIDDVLGVMPAAEDRDALHRMLAANLVHTGCDEAASDADRAAFELFDNIAQRVNEQFGLDLSDKEFRLRFTLHLKNLMLRGREGALLRNPQLQAIKGGQPFIYDVAVFIAGMVQDAAGAPINEDEIAYIALHIGCLVEEQRISDGKLHVVLVCVRHGAYDSTRIEGFLHEIDGVVVVDGIVNALDELEGFDNIDLVISSVPVAGAIDTPIVNVSPYLSKRDAQIVNKRADELCRRRVRNDVESGIRLFFNEEFFQVEPAASDWRSVIELMGNELIARGYAFDDFVERLLEREEMSSSAYREIALPHPVDMNARKTAVSVALFPHGLSWNGTVVYVVIMLAIKRDDRAFFSEIFNYVAGILMNPGAVRALARSKTFDDFTETLLGAM